MRHRHAGFVGEGSQVAAAPRCEQHAPVCGSVLALAMLPIRDLDLCDYGMEGAEGGAAVARAVAVVPSLIRLRLSQNEFRSEEVAALAAVPEHRELAQVELHFCGLKSEMGGLAAVALAASLPALGQSPKKKQRLQGTPPGAASTAPTTSPDANSFSFVSALSVVSTAPEPMPSTFDVLPSDRTQEEDAESTASRSR